MKTLINQLSKTLENLSFEVLSENEMIQLTGGVNPPKEKDVFDPDEK